MYVLRQNKDPTAAIHTDGGYMFEKTCVVTLI